MMLQDKTVCRTEEMYSPILVLRETRACAGSSAHTDPHSRDARQRWPTTVRRRDHQRHVVGRRGAAVRVQRAPRLVHAVAPDGGLEGVTHDAILACVGVGGVQRQQDVARFAALCDIGKTDTCHS